MKILKEKNKNFFTIFKKKLNERIDFDNSKIDKTVKKIISDIILYGDKALFDFTKKYDNLNINSSNILLTKKILCSYKNSIDPDTLKSFKVAIKNIKNFHSNQKPSNYSISSKGVKTSIVWKPINSVGLYIPGGKAVYPSSLIMNAVPAKIAGVERIVVVTPTKPDLINPYFLAILDELSISEVYCVGGAQAIAALAYGTKSLKSVNKIFGPGNAFVASAKKQVYGKVGIDLIAGPSEIVVVADKYDNPKWVAADLIAQAEHDEKAQCILITDDINFAKKVKSNIKILSSSLFKKSIIDKSLNDFGIIIISENLEDTYKIINLIAPEHLHLHTKSRYKLLKKITNAGCIFLGEYSSEAFGDYIVGTNHVLPTSGSSKFSSGLGVLDFMKRTSLVEMNASGFKINNTHVEKMASVENLDGHKLSVKIRQDK